MVETPIHYPTDSGLLGDGVRVLTRLIQRAKPLLHDRVADGQTAFRNRMRSMRRTLQALYRVVRRKAESAAAEQRALYARLIHLAEQTHRQAQRIRQALRQLRPPRRSPTAGRRRLSAPKRLRAELDHLLPLVAQVIHQARTRVLAGAQVPAQENLVSLFEPHPRVLRRHKTGTPVEFGRQVVLDEVEGGIVTRFRVLGPGELERHELAPAVAHHRAVFGRAPYLVTGDRGFHVPGQELALEAAGVRHIVVPAAGRVPAGRRARERTRAWRRRYRWRAGIEGRIHSLRRDYGLRRCRAHSEIGLQRDVGWGLLASNLHHIATAQVARAVRLGAGHARAA